MTTALHSRQDIQKFITSFYQKLLADKPLGPIFTEVVETDLEEHLSMIG